MVTCCTGPEGFSISAWCQRQGSLRWGRSPDLYWRGGVSPASAVPSGCDSGARACRGGRGGRHGPRQPRCNRQYDAPISLVFSACGWRWNLSQVGQAGRIRRALGSNLEGSSRQNPTHNAWSIPSTYSEVEFRTQLPVCFWSSRRPRVSPSRRRRVACSCVVFSLACHLLECVFSSPLLDTTSVARASPSRCQCVVLSSPSRHSRSLSDTDGEVASPAGGAGPGPLVRLTQMQLKLSKKSGRGGVGAADARVGEGEHGCRV